MRYNILPYPIGHFVVRDVTTILGLFPHKSSGIVIQVEDYLDNLIGHFLSR